MSGRGEPVPADSVVRMVRAGLLTLLALLPVAAGVGWLVAARPGLVGALIGLALPALVLGVTLAAALLTRRSRPEVLAAAVLGSYLLKLVLVLVVLAVLRGLDSYDRPVLGVTALVGLAVALVAESAAMVRAKVPYVTPAPADAPGRSGLSA
ncbi:MAG: hypothetical protein M3P95_09660 [Actinomycetota bacterium]|jgi:chromate transport protein ChrA|nr:hypothetical protein [Actinomycetota bacterium]